MKKLLVAAAISAACASGVVNAAATITATLAPSTPTVNLFGFASMVATVVNSGTDSAEIRVNVDATTANEWHGINGGINIQSQGCTHLGGAHVSCLRQIGPGQSITVSGEYTNTVVGTVPATCAVQFSNTAPPGSTINDAGCASAFTVVSPATSAVGVRMRPLAGVINTNPLTAPIGLEIDIDNGGQQPASAFTLTGGVPAIPPSDPTATDFQITSISAPGGYTCSHTSTSYTCNVPALAPGGSGMVNVGVSTNLPYFAPVVSGIPSNTVQSFFRCSVTGGGLGGAGSVLDAENCTEQFIVVMPATNFSKSVDAPTAAIGDIRTFTIQANRPSAVGTATTALTIIDDLPAGLEYVSASGTGFTCTHTAPRTTCINPTPDAAPAIFAYTVQVQARVVQAGVFTPLCHGDWAYPLGYGNINALPVGSYQLCRATVRGLAPVLGVTKTHTPATFTVNQPQGQIAISVSNTGTTAATPTITVVDYLPAGVQFVSSPTAGWACAADAQQVVTCTNPSLTLGVNVSTILRLDVLVTPAAAGQSSLLNVVGVGNPQLPMPTDCRANTAQAQCGQDNIPVTLPVSLQSFTIE